MKILKKAGAIAGSVLFMTALTACYSSDVAARLYPEYGYLSSNMQNSRGTDVVPDLRVSHAPVTSQGTLVFVHGGAWMSGTADLVNLPESLAVLSHSGWDIVSVAYRLAPKTDVAGMVSDVRASVRYVRTHAQQLGVNASTVILAGHSSGAHLAALAAFDKPILLERPDGVILLAAPVDMSVFAADQNLIYGYSKSAIVNHALGCGYEGPRDVLRCSRSALEKASPLYAVDKNAPPTYLAYGALDEVVPLAQGEALYATLVAKIGPDRTWLDVARRSGHAVEGANQGYIELFASLVANGSIQ
jgi:acetyl esterase/lipase